MKANTSSKNQPKYMFSGQVVGGSADRHPHLVDRSGTRRSGSDTHLTSDATEELQREITERTRTEMALANRGVLSRILQHVPDGIVVCDAQGKITLANAVAKQLAQKEPEGMSLDAAPYIWRELYDLNGSCIPAADWPFRRALRGQTVISEEYHLIGSNGSTHYIMFSASPIRTPDREIVGMVATLTDITEHKRGELMKRQEAMRRERGRMAADLHDTICQGLNAIVLQLEAAEEGFVNDASEAEYHTGRALELARESLNDVRRSIWMLDCESLQNEDLASALSLMTKRIFAGTPVKPDLVLPQNGRKLSQDMRLELLRIAKEALANVLKHARAANVYVALAYKPHEVQLSVNDDGQGFTVLPPRVAHGYGLIGMRQRAERLGGNIVVDSEPGRGTRVFARLPLCPEILQWAVA